MVVAVSFAYNEMTYEGRLRFYESQHSKRLLFDLGISLLCRNMKASREARRASELLRGRKPRATLCRQSTYSIENGVQRDFILAVLVTKTWHSYQFDDISKWDAVRPTCCREAQYHVMPDNILNKAYPQCHRHISENQCSSCYHWRWSVHRDFDICNRKKRWLIVRYEQMLISGRLYFMRREQHDDECSMLLNILIKW